MANLLQAALFAVHISLQHKPVYSIDARDATLLPNFLENFREMADFPGKSHQQLLAK